MIQEDISENIGESHHCKNLIFENFGEFQVKLVSPGLIYSRSLTSILNNPYASILYLSMTLSNQRSITQYKKKLKIPKG